MRKFYSFFAAVVMAASFNAQTTTVLTEDFAAYSLGTPTSPNSADVYTNGTNVSTFPTGTKVYQAGGMAKFGTGSSSGSMTTGDLDLSTDGGNVRVTFDVKGWSSVEGPMVVTLSGAAPQEITYTAVQAGTPQTVSVEFPAAGTASSTVTIATKVKRAYIDNVKIETYSTSATPVLNVDAEAVEFPQTEVDKTSVESVTVTAENLTEDITYSVSGADADDFTVTGELTAEGGSLEVTFAPTAVGVKTAVLTITSGDLTKTVNLSGEAVAAGTLAVSNASATKVVLVKNTVATDELIFAQEAQVTLVNMNGQIVKNAKVSNGTALNVSALPNGIYLVTAVVNGKPVSQKIIKK